MRDASLPAEMSKDVSREINDKPILSATTRVVKRCCARRALLDNLQGVAENRTNKAVQIGVDRV